MACTHDRQLREAARLAALLETAAAKVRRPARSFFSSGCAALDRALPGGGFARGSLIEWIGAGPGGGASTLAVVAAREAQQAVGAIVVIDRDLGFYPPAAAAWRLDLAGMLVVHPRNEADERWALDQALRCEHAAAVLAWPRRLEGRTFRRLQLAAEASGVVGLLVRPAAARHEPSWAHVRLATAPRPATGGGWHVAVEILRLRGGAVMTRDPTRERVEILLEIDPASGELHEARVSHLAAELARAAAGAGQA
jgi:cell division inhibitor SulA/protein ImuA